MQILRGKNVTFFENLSLLSIFVEIRKLKMAQKQERTVIHLEKDGKHYYFGSLSGIYEVFDKEDIGITYGSLRNYGLSEDKPYQNKSCVIRKGILITTPKTK